MAKVNFRLISPVSKMYNDVTVGEILLSTPAGICFGRKFSNADNFW